MKKFLYSIAAACLLATLLVPTAMAGSLYSPDLYYWEQEHPLHHFQYSPWAEDSIEAFLDWKTIPLGEEDLREPVSRGDYAELAAALTAMEWGSNLSSVPCSPGRGVRPSVLPGSGRDRRLG